MYLVCLYAAMSVFPTLLAKETPTLATSVAYTCITFFVATSLWDSRVFIADTFKYQSALLARPHSVTLPITIILVLTSAFPTQGIQVCLLMSLSQAIMTAAVTEFVYSICKRNEWFLRTRRESLPRVISTMVTPTFNQTRIQFR
jgi:hypothetical protein